MVSSKKDWYSASRRPAGNMRLSELLLELAASQALSDEASACHIPPEKSRFSDSPRMYQMNRACGRIFAVWVA
jgi:hypothetical protein